MNTSLRINKGPVILLAIFLLTVVPSGSISAQSKGDDFGVWGTAEFSQKVTKKTKFVIDAEVRSIEAVSNIERIAVGAKIDYKIIKWLKANIGYSFIYGHTLSEKSIKDEVNKELGLYNYNIDDDYWNVRNRVYLTLTGEYKIGRVEISLRERLQYTHTSSATVNETKVRWERVDAQWKETAVVEPEFKKAKHNLSLRSRLHVKYDIPKCKITPFASVELYTRLDEWKGYDKLRYRAGATYKINKKNALSLYYLYQDKSDDDEPSGHAVGLEYSIDL